MEEKKQRGGRREGAGRKSDTTEPKVIWTIRVTEEEKPKVKAFLAELRRDSK